MTLVYDEVIDFIAGCNPGRVAEFQPSDAARQRVAYLLSRVKDDGLTSEESSELDTYRNLEHIMRLAKARAVSALPMSSYVSKALRRLVAERAENLCEYCLIHRDQTFFGCEIEHIIAEKHGGATVPENLALSCFFCNSFKGTDITSLSQGVICRLFNPRSDRWRDHFALEEGIIRPLTNIGDATVRLLRMNDAERVEERNLLRKIGEYPTPEAVRRMA